MIMKFNILFITCFLINLTLLAQTSSIGVKRNDLAFLYPVNITKSAYIGAQELLHIPKHQKIIDNLTPKLKDFFPSMYVVGVKLLVCHKVVHNRGECLPQIRFVLQSTFSQKPAKDNVTLEFADDALHVFYNLSNSEFKKILEFISVTNQKNSNEWVHTLLSTNSGAVLFKKKVLSLLKTKIPSLVTGMEGDNVLLWNFFKIYPKYSEEKILDLPELLYSKATRLGSLDFNNLACAAKDLDSPCDENNLQILVKELWKLEDAKLTHVDSTSCVNCHSIGPIKTLLKFSKHKYHLQLQVGEFKKQYIEEVMAPKESGISNVRQLGYFKSQPTVSKRTISEIDQQLELLRK